MTSLSDASPRKFPGAEPTGADKNLTSVGCFTRDEFSEGESVTCKHSPIPVTANQSSGSACKDLLSNMAALRVQALELTGEEWTIEWSSEKSDHSSSEGSSEGKNKGNSDGIQLSLFAFII